MTLKLHRPDADGNLSPSPATAADYRTQLRSRRWDAAPLDQNEVDLPDKRLAVLALVAFAILTFVIIVIGYGLPHWG
ncbi:MAG: hypothetical protein R3C32_10840 [Chloroflexota bacterium]